MKNPSLGSVLPTHGLAYANPRHWCVKYPVNLLYDIPTLVKEGETMSKSMISSTFPHKPFSLDPKWYKMVYLCMIDSFLTILRKGGCIGVIGRRNVQKKGS